MMRLRLGLGLAQRVANDPQQPLNPKPIKYGGGRCKDIRKLIKQLKNYYYNNY